MAAFVSSLAATVLEALRGSGGAGKGSIVTAARTVVRYPVKLVAAFFTAPLLALRVARGAKNPVRRCIAGAGLFVAMLGAWLAGSALGTLTAALFIISKFSLFWGIAFLIGTTASVVLSVTLSFLVLNATCLLFLHMSKEEVIEYLRTLSE